jgi:RNA polymerase sigma-70 factor (ECF subfamily)
MKLFLYAGCFVVLTVALLGATTAHALNLEHQPPVVIRTVPASGAKSVDPALSEIRVTFSKEMTDRSWSWVQIAPENFPELLGEPRYLEDKKTCVVDVRLDPGKTYIIWLNTQRFSNFRDADGRPAQPYLLMFETGAGKKTSGKQRIRRSAWSLRAKRSNLIFS